MMERCILYVGMLLVLRASDTRHRRWHIWFAYIGLFGRDGGSWSGFRQRAKNWMSATPAIFPAGLISPRRLCAEALKHDSLDNPREEWDQSHPLRPQSPRFALAASAASSDVVLAARGRGAATRWERDTKKVHSHCLPAGAQNCKCGSTTTWSKAKTCTNWIAKTCELKPRNAVSF